LEPEVPLRRVKSKKDKEDDSSSSDSDSDSDEGEEFAEHYEIPPERTDIFIITKGIPLPPLLKEESKQQAKDYREKYHESPHDSWVQKFSKNPHYSIVDNEAGGDCLFATIRDAFSSIAQQTSVNKIRKKLASEATEKVFLGYKEQYDMYKDSLVRDTNKIKELEGEYLLLKQRFTQVMDRNEQKIISVAAKDVKKEHDRLVEEKKVTAEILKEYKFLKGIDTLEAFKSKIKSCNFWADTWAISTLERILNIKLIILSSELYKSGDSKNVLQCGQLNDDILQQRGRFVPEFYIIVDHTGDHYKLIGYKKKLIFKKKFYEDHSRIQKRNTKNIAKNYCKAFKNYL
jgi:hypothetical protein